MLNLVCAPLIDCSINTVVWRRYVKLLCCYVFYFEIHNKVNINFIYIFHRPNAYSVGQKVQMLATELQAKKLETHWNLYPFYKWKNYVHCKILCNLKILKRVKTFEHDLLSLTLTLLNFVVEHTYTFTSFSSPFTCIRTWTVLLITLRLPSQLNLPCLFCFFSSSLGQGYSLIKCGYLLQKNAKFTINVAWFSLFSRIFFYVQSFLSSIVLCAFKSHILISVVSIIRIGRRIQE